MNLLILALFIPLSFAGSPPACKELGEILQNYEVAIQRDTIKECKPDLYKILIKNIPVKNPTFLEGKVCQDLSTIEAQIQQLKMELAVMNGIHKLVETVGIAKLGTDATKKPEVIRSNARTFVVSLNTAQSLEVLLQSTTADGKPFMQALKEFPENKRISHSDLADRVSELCAKKSRKELDACNPKVFTPGPEATEEIYGMIKNTNPDLKKISEWQGQLSIKRKTSKDKNASDDYSFTQMQNELGGAFEKIDNKEVMTKAQILAIQKLDDFKYNPQMGFIQDISLLKDQKKKKIASDKFFLLMGDAKLRQQYEVQSKLSIVWEDIKERTPELSAEAIAQCDKSKSHYEAAVECTRSLEKIRPTIADTYVSSKINQFLPALKVSTNYIEKLSEKESVCQKELKASESVTEACFAEFNRDRADLQDKILQLNIIKDKIGAQNVTPMKFRNLALQKWTSQRCQSLTTAMDMCEDTSVFSQSASLTFSDTMKIAVLFTASDAAKSTAEAAAEAVCDDDTRGEPSRIEQRLCEFFNDTTPNVIKTENNKDVNSPGLQAPKGNVNTQVKDAWIEGGSNILKEMLPFFMPQNSSYTPNPYPYNYGPYNGGIPPMGISDSILFNARYHGSYGYYMPTPGYRPYTAFGAASPMSAYRPVAAPSTRYFSY